MNFDPSQWSAGAWVFGVCVLIVLGLIIALPIIEHFNRKRDARLRSALASAEARAKVLAGLRCPEKSPNAYWPCALLYGHKGDHAWVASARQRGWAPPPPKPAPAAAARPQRPVDDDTDFGGWPAGGLSSGYSSHSARAATPSYEGGGGTFGGAGASGSWDSGSSGSSSSSSSSDSSSSSSDSGSSSSGSSE